MQQQQHRDRHSGSSFYVYYSYVRVISIRRRGRTTFFIVEWLPWRPVPDCDVCVVSKSHQLAHPKIADHKVKLPSWLIFADLMEPLTPEAPRGYKHVTKLPDEHTKWTETCMLESDHDTLISFQALIQSVVFPSGFYIERF